MAHTGDGIYTWGVIGPFCSACAPKHISSDDVAKSVSERMGVTYYVIDVADIRPGPKSPQKCNQDSGRLHWLLMKDPDK